LRAQARLKVEELAETKQRSRPLRTWNSSKARRKCEEAQEEE